jgi:NAD(P)-dependent dehydrogenase (short-subunit alcohol dehydrogenase family)
MGFWGFIGRVLYVLVILLVAVEVAFAVYQLLKASHKYWLMEELDLPERYGIGTWVIITGASSGQGRQFALQWAARGFNLLLIGSLRTELVIDEIAQLHPNVEVRFIAKDFGQAFENGFFDEIEQAVRALPGEVSVLINSVGHRVGWKPYHEMPVDKIRDTIATGTMVQARLMHFMLPRLLNRRKRSLIVSITAQCMHPNFALGGACGLGNEITVPYLTVYEPTNAWGYFNMQSVIAEYGDRLDLLNITPGAVKTVNTVEALNDTIGAIDDVRYVENIFRMMGNVQGETCAHWAHAATMIAVNFAPWLKGNALRTTGEKLAATYMRKHQSSASKSYELPKPKMPKYID